MTVSGSGTPEIVRPEDAAERRHRLAGRLRRLGPDALIVARRPHVRGGRRRGAGARRPASIAERRHSCSPSWPSPSSRGTGPPSRPRSARSSLYDFLFIEPLYTLTVRDPTEWLNLCSCSSSGSWSAGSPGGSATVRRPRSRASARRSALFSVSFTLANRARPGCARCRRSPGCSATRSDARVWVIVGETTVGRHRPGRQPATCRAGGLRDPSPPPR